MSLNSARMVALAAALAGPAGVVAGEPAPDAAAETRMILEQATTHFVEGRYQVALDLMRSVADEVTDDGSVHWNMARCLEELGRTREAIASFEKARSLATRPEDAQAAVARIAALRSTLPAILDVQCTGVAAVAAVSRPCPARFELPAGRHRVSVRDGALESTMQVRLVAGETHQIGVEAVGEPGAGAARAVGWVLLGGAVLAIGGGVLASLAADRAAADAAETTDRDRYDALRDDHRVATALTWTAYAAGAALAGAGVWFVLDDGDQPQAAGLTLSGRW